MLVYKVMKSYNTFGINDSLKLADGFADMAPMQEDHNKPLIIVEDEVRSVLHHGHHAGSRPSSRQNSIDRVVLQRAISIDRAGRQFSTEKPILQRTATGGYH